MDVVRGDASSSFFICLPVPSITTLSVDDLSEICRGADAIELRVDCLTCVKELNLESILPASSLAHLLSSTSSSSSSALSLDSFQAALESIWPASPLFDRVRVELSLLRRRALPAQLPIMFTVRTKPQGGCLDVEAVGLMIHNAVYVGSNCKIVDENKSSDSPASSWASNLPPASAPKLGEWFLFALLRLGLRLGCELVDMECCWSPHARARLMSQRGQSRIIASMHFPQSDGGSEEDLIRVIEDCAHCPNDQSSSFHQPADIVKVVVRASSIATVHRLEHVRERIKENANRQVGNMYYPPMILLAMGPQGQLSRVFNQV